MAPLQTSCAILLSEWSQSSGGYSGSRDLMGREPFSPSHRFKVALSKGAITQAVFLFVDAVNAI